jgi:hypothetical protein
MKTYVHSRGSRPIVSATILCAVLLCAIFTTLPSCSKRKESPQRRQTDPVYGFNLGETKKDLFSRALGKVSWQELPPGNRWDYRGDLYRFSGPLDDSEGIDYVRLAFFDGRLMEVIAYYRDNSRTKLERLKMELEERYGGTMVAPDGTRETVYKTYRMPGPGRSITLRRITKTTGIELYVQYLDSELHARLIQRKLEKESE